MIIFYIDYRSPPSGVGSFTSKSGKKVLIQTKGVTLNPEGYDTTIQLSYEDITKECLEKIKEILIDYEVTHVYDSELFYDLYPENNRIQSLPLQTWLDKT